MTPELTVQVLRYFGQFGYAPTLEEMYLFSGKRMELSAYAKNVANSVKNGKIHEKDCGDGSKRYTLREYIRAFQKVKKRMNYSQEKKAGLRPFLTAAAYFPSVRLIGLSGSVAMNNAQKDDDIDLFVITGKDRMYTARFWLLLTAWILGQKRAKNASKSHASNKICLNMFFDEKDLRIPPDKHNYYVAHEVLQMKPLLSTGTVYGQFIKANSWVSRIFPNANTVLSRDYNIISRTERHGSFLGNCAELILKKIQLWRIRRTKTNERVTDTQLWFFPDDFQKKVTMEH